MEATSATVLNPADPRKAPRRNIVLADDEGYTWGMASRSLSGYIRACLQRAEADYYDALDALAHVPEPHVRAALDALSNRPPAKGEAPAVAVESAFRASPQIPQQHGVPTTTLGRTFSNPRLAEAVVTLAWEAALGRRIP